MTMTFSYLMHLMFQLRPKHAGSHSVARSKVNPHANATVLFSALLFLAVLGCGGDKVILQDSLLVSVETTSPHAATDDPTRSSLNLAEITYMDHFAVLSIGSSRFKLEVASSPIELQTGLMERSNLAPDEGMLFSFGHEEKWGLWMKQTLVPLDAIWLDSTGSVVHITTMPVQIGVPDSQLVVYAPTTPSLYAIELPAGTAQRVGIELGMKIDIAHAGSR